MSDITNVMLLLNGFYDNDQRITEVNHYFETREDMLVGWKVPGLVSVDNPKLPRGWYGGDKIFVAGFYIGAYNYLDLPSFFQHLASIDWQEPDPFQLFVMEEEDDIFRVLTLSDIKREVALFTPTNEEP